MFCSRWVILSIVAAKTIVDGFTSYPHKGFRFVKKPISKLSLLPESTLNYSSGILQTSSLFALNMGNLRQYVPLVVISAVIIDILCGSPLANLLLAPMRRAANSKLSQDEERLISKDTSASQIPLPSSKKSNLSSNPSSTERIDTVAVAQAAIQKAKNTMELRKFLEENKTDKDRMEDWRKKIDSQLRSLDK